jgi:uncharacterized protein YbjT (DUF2867 family)
VGNDFAEWRRPGADAAPGRAMSADRALIIGATGMLGGPVAQQLAADGWRVRCLVRNVDAARARLGSAFEYVAADVTIPHTLDAAFEGCSCVHINLRGNNTVESYERIEVGGAIACIDAAARHGLRRVSYLSGAGRMDAGTERFFPVRIKRRVEGALAAGSVPWTVFRATHFMESLPQFVRDGRAAVVGRQPHRLHYVAARDYARMVGRALRTDAASNQVFYVLGPEAFTMREALQMYLAACHPELRVQTLPLPIARLMAALTGNRDLRFAAELFAAFAAIGETGDPSQANALLGAPATRLREWLDSRSQSTEVAP